MKWEEFQEKKINEKYLWMVKTIVVIYPDLIKNDKFVKESC